MIYLHFAGSSPADSVTHGPATWFRLDGGHIRQGPDGAIVGEYLSNHQWEVRGKFFTRYDFLEPAVIRFEDATGGASEEFGPFARVYAADGVMYADGHLFARFADDSKLWHCYPTNSHWPAIVVKPARSP
jgi:hypothetical protein